jgi:hypothetical protein
MRPLSAIDAISPAWAHTRNLLWRPRNWRLLLKIGFVAVLAQMAGFNFSGGNHFGGPMHHGHHALSSAMWASIVAGIVAIAIVGFVVWLAIFYAGSRMQFVLFEVVLRRDTEIAPIWRRYGAATWRWIGLKLAFLAVVLVVLAPILAPMAIHMFRTLPHLEGSDPRRVVGFVLGMLGFGMVIFVVSLLIGAAYRLLVSFALPSMALESTTLRESVRRVAGLAQAEPVDVFLFLLMTVLMGFAGGVVASVAVGLTLVVALVPLGGVAALLWVALHHAGIVGHVVVYGVCTVTGLIVAALTLIVGVIAFGYLYAFLQAYALYFLGGRYPRVGAYLEPLLPPAPAYMPGPGFAAPPTS